MNKVWDTKYYMAKQKTKMIFLSLEQSFSNSNLFLKKECYISYKIRDVKESQKTNVLALGKYHFISWCWLSCAN